MKTYKIPAGIYAANCYVLVDDNKLAIMIDPGGSEEELIEFIEKNNLELEYIVLTHGHADHIGGVEKLKEHFDIPVIAHEDAKELLEDSEKNLSTQMLRKPIEIVPDILVNETSKLELGELEIDIIHTPGHTKGGMCLKVNNVLFAGDTLFKNSLGRSDLHGGNQEELLNSIKEKLLVLDDDTEVLPGHGEKTTIGEEKMLNPFLN